MALNYSLTLIGVLSVLVGLTSILQLYGSNVWETSSVISNVEPSATIRLSRKFGSRGSAPKENNKLTFDLESDLTQLFNWNTKQVFVYLTAEYPGKTENSSNKVTYWDKIITSKDNANLTLKNVHSKYSVWDVEDTFRNKEATVKLEWNIQPYVGALLYGQTSGESMLVFPDPPTQEEARKAKMEKRQKKAKARAGV